MFTCSKVIFINLHINCRTMVKLQKASGSQHMVTIPEELRKAMGWQKGDKLKFSVVDDETLEVSMK